MPVLGSGIHDDDDECVGMYGSGESGGNFRRLVAIELGFRPDANEAEIFEALKQLRARVLGDPEKDPMSDT